MTNIEITLTKRKILLGMHDTMMGTIMSGFCLKLGYNSTIVHTPGEFLDEMKQENFDRYLTEANLGISNGRDLNPARLSYNLLVSTIGKEEASKRFLAVTANDDYIRVLDSEGIPAKCKPLGFADIKAFLA